MWPVVDIRFHNTTVFLFGIFFGVHGVISGEWFSLLIGGLAAIALTSELIVWLRVRKLKTTGKDSQEVTS